MINVLFNFLKVGKVFNNQVNVYQGMFYEIVYFILWLDVNEKENLNEIKMGEYCYKIYNIVFYYIYKFIF